MKSLVTAAVVALAAPSLAHAADVAGTWSLQLMTDQGNLPVSCTLTQTENTIGGACDGNTATGSVNGDDVTFNYHVTFGGQPLHVTYTGRVGADGGLSGNFNAPPYSGTFTGTRASAAPAAAAAPAASQ